MMDLILLTVLSALLCAMLPGASIGGFRKVFSFAAGLALLLAVFRPIAGSITSLAELPTQWMERILPDEEEMKAEEDRAREWALSFSAENIEKGVDALIVSRYGLPADVVVSTAEVEMNAEGQWILKRMVIHIDASVVCDDEGIAQYIRDILACPCAVLRTDAAEIRKGGGVKYAGENGGF